MKETINNENNIEEKAERQLKWKNEITDIILMEEMIVIIMKTMIWKWQYRNRRKWETNHIMAMIMKWNENNDMKMKK